MFNFISNEIYLNSEHPKNHTIKNYLDVMIDKAKSYVIEDVNK